MYQCLLCRGKDHSLWHSRRTQRVSFRAAVCRITKEWAVVMLIFHPGREPGVIFFSGLIAKMLFPWDCYWGRFPRLFFGKEELVASACSLEQCLWWTQGAQAMSPSLGPNEHFWAQSPPWGQVGDASSQPAQQPVSPQTLVRLKDGIKWNCSLQSRARTLSGYFFLQYPYVARGKPFCASSCAALSPPVTVTLQVYQTINFTLKFPLCAEPCS